MKISTKSSSQRTGRVTSNSQTPTAIEECDSSGRMVISVFPTALGWMGLLGDNGQLVSVFIGRATENAVRAAAVKFTGSLDDRDWHPTVRRMLEGYAEGEIVDFSSVEIRLPQMSSFRQKIVNATRRLGYGETVSYGELARRAGHPRAVRAVGTVMSTNRFPILLPCHRVLARGGKLGGYTSPGGTNLKQRMLDLEAQASGFPPNERRVYR